MKRRSTTTKTTAAATTPIGPFFCTLKGRGCPKAVPHLRPMNLSKEWGDSYPILDGAALWSRRSLENWIVTSFRGKAARETFRRALDVEMARVAGVPMYPLDFGEAYGPVVVARTWNRAVRRCGFGAAKPDGRTDEERRRLHHLRVALWTRMGGEEAAAMWEGDFLKRWSRALLGHLRAGTTFPAEPTVAA